MKGITLITKPIVLALLIVPAIILGACAEKTAENKSQLQLIEHNLIFHNFGDVLKSIVAIDGKAQNAGNTTISAASITVHFYDKDGNRLHTASAVKNDLGAGEIWYFNVRFIGPDAWKTVRYDISVDTK